VVQGFEGAGAEVNLRTIGWCLVIGLIASIAIAMVGPIVLPAKVIKRCAGESSSRDQSWLFTAYDLDDGVARGSVDEMTQQAHRAQFALSPFEQLSRTDWTMHWAGHFRMVESGFPMRSFRGVEARQYIWSESPIALRTPYEYVGALHVPSTARYQEPWLAMVPLKPIWPGCLVNWMVWTFPAWALCTACVFASRWRRRRAGHCARCGYDLHGLRGASPCPECGSKAGGGAS